MKIMTFLNLPLLSLLSFSLQASMGQDMIGGIATGTVALGTFYIAKDEMQANGAPITETQAVAIAGLAGLIMTAVIQANLKESQSADAIVHMLTGLATFGLMKYLSDSFNPSDRMPVQPEPSAPPAGY